MTGTIRRGQNLYGEVRFFLTPITVSVHEQGYLVQRFGLASAWVYSMGDLAQGAEDTFPSHWLETRKSDQVGASTDPSEQWEDTGMYPAFLEDPTAAVGSLFIVQLWCLLFSLSHPAVGSVVSLLIN